MSVALPFPATPLGPIWLELVGMAPDSPVRALHWGAPPEGAEVRGEHPYLQELRAYFAGQLKVFSVPVAPEGSVFQRRVWQGLQGIPFGQTLSYGQLAARVGTHARPLGGANGCNPIPIIIPCHRVVGHNYKNGKGLGGFSAPGGLATKRWLLAHEGVLP